MQLTRSAAALVAAGLLWLPSAPLFAQSSNDEELRNEIKELRQKLERLEQRLEQQAAPAAPTAPATPPAALQQRIDELDQQVRVLGRKQEIQQEEQIAKAKADLQSSDATIRQGVGALISIMSGVALDPQPFDIVFGGKLIEAPPQVRVFNRFLIRGLPAASLPYVYPYGNPLLHILGIRV